jgi:feruloyl esterase
MAGACQPTGRSRYHDTIVGYCRNHPVGTSQLKRGQLVNISKILLTALVIMTLSACENTGNRGRRVSGTPAAISCQALGSQAPANTVIQMAQEIPAGEFDPPAGGPPGVRPDYSTLPAFCRIIGSMHPTSTSDIRFELWLPQEGWNGKFMQTGNGGAAGSIVLSSMVEPLRRGYAVANTDTGHQGSGSGFTWGHDYPEKLTDFGWRAVHELTVQGKAMTTTFYDMAPGLSYFNGCSTGGRQGLKEAQMFPNDYDAIIAGAPANNWSRLMSLSIIIQTNMGTDKLRPEHLRLLKESAISACDMIDGVQDRVISQPADCPFNPADLQCKTGEPGACLDVQEVQAAQRIYAGLIDGSGLQTMPGTGVGSEPLWGAYASGPFTIGTNFYRDLIKQDPAWDPNTFNPGADVAQALDFEDGSITAMDPDLSDFIRHGGKLLMYHGTTDGLIPFGNTTNYVEDMLAVMGETLVNEGTRFYVMPGMDHCSGGEGAWSVDWISVLENWVEGGVAPETLDALHPAVPAGLPGIADSNTESFSRLLCPYPQSAVYYRGDAKQAASFRCVAQ